MEYLSEEQVRVLLTYEDLIPAVERALIDYSAGGIQQPVRTVLRVPDHDGLFALMPAIDGELMCVKLVTVYEKNIDQPTHQAVIQLLSARTGEPLVAMDGRLITEMRTAAVSAVATRLLARKDARVLAILGSGVQARSHLQALRLVRGFEEVRVWSRTPANAAPVRFTMWRDAYGDCGIGGQGRGCGRDGVEHARAPGARSVARRGCAGVRSGSGWPRQTRAGQ